MAFFIRPDNEEVDAEKFLTCLHRLPEEVEYIAKETCCNRRKVKGFICFKLKINGLYPFHCLRCGAYERKE